MQIGFVFAYFAKNSTCGWILRLVYVNDMNMAMPKPIFEYANGVYCVLYDEKRFLLLVYSLFSVCFAIIICQLSHVNVFIE